MIESSKKAVLSGVYRLAKVCHLCGLPGNIEKGMHILVINNDVEGKLQKGKSPHNLMVTCSTCMHEVMSEMMKNPEEGIVIKKVCEVEN